MKPYQLWHRLPKHLRDGLRATGVFDIGRRTNDWLWRTDWYVQKKFEFTWITVSFDEFSTELYVPASEEPWWREYQQYGCHEPLTSKTVIDVIDEGDTFWDMGSRLGYFSTIAAVANGSPDHVHTFEKSVSRWRFVEENNRARFDGDMKVNNLAIGARDTNRSITGDTYARKNSPPEIVKIDIEGAEIAALRGMEETINMFRPTLVVEGHPELIQGYGNGDSDEDLIDFLQTYYDDIRISVDFRRPDGAWHEVEDLWEDRFDIVELSDQEFDHYQLFCRSTG